MRSSEFDLDSIGRLLNNADSDDGFDYELIDEIARGGMGVVYRARQLSLNRDAAVKFVLAGHLASRDSLERFKLEAQSAARLHHPGIVRIYEIGECKGLNFFSMELIDGVSLAECLDEFLLDGHSNHATKLAQQIRIANLLAQAARALEFAHKHGVLHRDVKPSNILIDEDGNPHLTDFGLAKLTGSEQTGLTLTHAVLGTPGYLAPEQAAGETDVTIAADVYGLGATLYELLTDSAPFSGATAVETIWKSIRDPVTPPRKLNPAVHRDLETIALRCLEKRPEQRYASAADLAEELERFARGEPILSRPIGAAEQFWRWCRRNPVVSSMSSVLALVILIGTGVALWQWGRAELANQKMAESLLSLKWDAIDSTIRSGQASIALAKTASLVRAHPNDWRAAMLGISLVEQNRFPIPTAPVIQHPERSELTFARLSSDGKVVLTGSYDGTARIWEAATSRELTTALHHGDKVNWGEISPNGSLVITCSDDRTVRFWNATTGNQIGDAIEFAERVLKFRLSPDGQSLLVITDRSLSLIDVVTRKWRYPLVSLDGNIAVADFTPDGKAFYAAQQSGENSGVRAWDTQTGTETLRFAAGEFQRIAVSRDLSRVATVNEMRCTIRDLPTGDNPQMYVVPTGTLDQLAFDDDGKRLSIVGHDHWARVLDVKSAMPLTPELSHDYLLNGSRFAGHGQLIITWAEDSLAQIWDSATGQRIAEPFRHKNRVQSVDVATSDGKELFLTMTSHLKSRTLETRTGSVQLWQISEADRSTVRLIASPTPGGHDGCRISNDGKWIAVGTTDQRVSLFDTSTGEPLCKPFAVIGGAWSILCTPDSSRLVVVTSQGEVSVRSIPCGELVARPMKLDTTFQPAEISNDGAAFATGSVDGMVRLWDIGTCEPIWEGKQGSEINAVAISPDGRYVASGGENRLIHIWDAKTGELLRSLKGHQNEIASLRFAPDGKSIVTGSHDFTARIWNVETGGSLHVLSHQGEVIDVIYSPDGRFVATGSRDRTAMIWNAKTGQPMFRSLRSDQGVRNVRFSPDSKRLLVLDFRNVRLWDTEQGFPITVPLKHHTHGGTGFNSTSNGPHFSPHGEYVLAAMDADYASYWHLPVPPSGSPEWFAPFLESIAGQRFAAGLDVPEAIPTAVFLELKSQILNSTETDFYTNWAKEWLCGK